jgi:hypothetical protein
LPSKHALGETANSDFQRGALSQHFAKPEKEKIEKMSLTLVISLVSGAIGVSAFTLSVLNYLRDRPKVRVTLKFDMAVSGEGMLDPAKPWGLISVTNAGRRPVFISIAAFGYWRGRALKPRWRRLPDGHFLQIAGQSVGGTKLGEGDAPVTYIISQDGLDKFAPNWNKVRAYVEDSTGKRYMSRPVSTLPSWAGGPWLSPIRDDSAQSGDENGKAPSKMN